jgi:aminodeoxychorismate synthase component I
VSRCYRHVATPLAAPVGPEQFAAAFPERGASTFVLDGAGAPPAAPSASLDRFAFMGAEPTASFRVVRLSEQRKSGRPLARVTDEGGSYDTADPFAALARFLEVHRVPAEVFDPAYPCPLRAGVIGYFAYEAGQFLERLPCLDRPSLGLPDIALSVHRWILATDRASGVTWLSVLGAGATSTDARDDADATTRRVLARLDGASADRRRPRASGGGGPADARSSLSRDEYVDRVGRAKAHIEAGDAFEICLTRALRAPLAQDRAWALYDELRRSSPAPFAALLDLPEAAIVSSSPERFVSLDAKGRVESRPIKGTRPRGRSPADDARLAAELARSEKDRAENAMIVDLVRNDLGRVCRFGTVDVPELYTVESYATVHQLVSTIRGELEPGHGAVDLLRAAFPPGSMTGAPKIEAMTILERLEPVERGPYAGALGWIDAAGAMDLSVVIRTAVVTGGVATFSVGGAVVADSDPVAEHEETEHKARAISAALGNVGASPRPPRDHASTAAP